jgi:hypothetical protein
MVERSRTQQNAPATPWALCNAAVDCPPQRDSDREHIIAVDGARFIALSVAQHLPGRNPGWQSTPLAPILFGADLGRHHGMNMVYGNNVIVAMLVEEANRQIALHRLRHCGIIAPTDAIAIDDEMP